MSEYLDNEEQELMESLNDVDFKSIKNDVDNIQLLQAASKSFVKETKINISFSTSELEKIKRCAESEGVKYQAFIKSILHKYVTDQLVAK